MPHPHICNWKGNSKIWEQLTFSQNGNIFLHKVPRPHKTMKPKTVIIKQQLRTGKHNSYMKRTQELEMKDTLFTTSILRYLRIYLLNPYSAFSPKSSVHWNSPWSFLFPKDATIWKIDFRVKKYQVYSTLALHYVNPFKV